MIRSKNPIIMSDTGIVEDIESGSVERIPVVDKSEGDSPEAGSVAYTSSDDCSNLTASKSKVLSARTLKKLENMRVEGVLLLKKDDDKILEEFSETRVNTPEMTVKNAIIRSITLADNIFSSAQVRELVKEILKRAFLSQKCRTKEALLKVLLRCEEAIQKYQASLADPTADSSPMADENNSQQHFHKEVEAFKGDTDAYIEKLLCAQNLEQMDEIDSMMNQGFVIKLFKHLGKTDRPSVRLTRGYRDRVTTSTFGKVYEMVLNLCSDYRINKNYIDLTDGEYYPLLKKLEGLDYNQFYEEALKDYDFWPIDGINSAIAEVVRKYGGGSYSILTPPNSPKVLLEHAIRDPASFKLHSMKQLLELFHEVIRILLAVQTRYIALEDARAYIRVVAQLLCTVRFGHQIMSLPAEDAIMCKVLETYAGLLKKLYDAGAMTADQVLEELLPPLTASSSKGSEKSREQMQAPMNACLLRGSWNSSCTLKLLQLIQYVLKHESEEKSCALREEVIKRLSKKFLDDDGNPKTFYKLIKLADKLKPCFYNKLILYHTNLVKKNSEIHKMCQDANKEFTKWHIQEQDRRMSATDEREFCEAFALFAKLNNLPALEDLTSEMLERRRTRKRVNFSSEGFTSYNESFLLMHSRERIKRYIEEGNRITEEFLKTTYKDLANVLEQTNKQHVKIDAMTWSEHQIEELMKELEAAKSPELNESCEKQNETRKVTFADGRRARQPAGYVQNPSD